MANGGKLLFVVEFVPQRDLSKVLLRRKCSVFPIIGKILVHAKDPRILGS